MKRRALLGGTVVWMAIASAAAAMPDDGWPVVDLASPRQVELSGRFLELASLTSLPGHHSPPTLEPALVESGFTRRLAPGLR
jgi:hypothetical protein